MKKIHILLFIGLFSQFIFAQDDDVIYSFTTNNHKIMQLLYNENNKIFIYRLLSNKKIDLEVKDDLKDNDIVFSVHGYHRGGGIQNAAMDYNDIIFSNNGYYYDIYYVWCVNEEDENIVSDPVFGIKVYKDGIEIADMKGCKIITGEIYGWSFYDILPELKSAEE
jgi:hypothetical protein